MGSNTERLFSFVSYCSARLVTECFDVEHAGLELQTQELESLLLFEEQVPEEISNPALAFHSECPPDRTFKSENLFEFRRGRGDFHASIAAVVIAVIFLAFFWTETGWQNRKLPENFGNYIGYQFGLSEIEGRAARLGSLLKQSWVAPLLCLMILVPASIINLRASWRVHRWRQRFMLPTSAKYEASKYLAALEYVVYFILYTLFVPIVGYLLSTLLLGVYLTWRLGYRSPKWFLTALLSSFSIVVVFRSFLQIKTPISIWLYDQLPAAARTFMLTYF